MKATISNGQRSQEVEGINEIAVAICEAYDDPDTQLVTVTIPKRYDDQPSFDEILADQTDRRLMAEALAAIDAYLEENR